MKQRQLVSVDGVIAGAGLDSNTSRDGGYVRDGEAGRWKGSLADPRFPAGVSVRLREVERHRSG